MCTKGLLSLVCSKHRIVSPSFTSAISLSLFHTSTAFGNSSDHSKDLCRFPSDKFIRRHRSLPSVYQSQTITVFRSYQAMANEEPSNDGRPVFQVQPVTRFAGAGAYVRRPREFTCFSYDENHEFHPDESSLRWYYPAEVGADLSKGHETFKKHDDSQDEHLVSLLKSLQIHEQKTGERVQADIVTWRGMMTKLVASPFERRDGFEMNATFYDGTIFIEENHAYKAAQRTLPLAQQRRSRIPPEVMTFWGYKFETLSTLAAPWGATPRRVIESRPYEPVSNLAQYCSVVNTAIGDTSLILGGEIDALWDSKPADTEAAINWVELKTSKSIRNPRDQEFFHEKLMKFWLQSFLLGVPKIIVGFRSPDGILESIDEIETAKIPEIAGTGDNARWNANVCINFGAALLEWLKQEINDEGVWRIARAPGQPNVTLERIESQGYGDILTEEFVNWRIKMHVNETSGPFKPQSPSTLSDSDNGGIKL